MAKPLKFNPDCPDCRREERERIQVNRATAKEIIARAARRREPALLVKLAKHYLELTDRKGR